MLPDLWRMADRRVRAARSRVVSGSHEVREVLEGVLHHERADRAFHACPAFVRGERDLGTLLDGVGAPRLALFGHIAWELCLDGALVRREGEAFVAGVQRAVLDASRPRNAPPPIETAATLHHAARKGEPLPAEFGARMDRIVHELGRGPWIAGYARGAFVADRLDGIRVRLGLPRFEPDERARTATLLDEAIERCGEALDDVLALPV